MTEYKPLIPNSPEEGELEMEIFDFLNNNPQEIPIEAQELIRKLWKEVVFREVWYYEGKLEELCEITTSGK